MKIRWFCFINWYINQLKRSIISISNKEMQISLEKKVEKSVLKTEEKPIVLNE